MKMAYKAMRRQVMEQDNDARLRTQAAKVYGAIGRPLPEERAPENAMPSRSHGGSVVVTTFHPTEPGPKLNVVHGPLANKDPLLANETPVVGLPIVGAGLEARMRSDHPADNDSLGETGAGNDAMQSVAANAVPEEKPYFYPKRSKRGTAGIKKRSRRQSRHPKNKPGVPFI